MVTPVSAVSRFTHMDIPEEHAQAGACLGISFSLIILVCRYSSSVERQLPKLERRVRFPLSAYRKAECTVYTVVQAFFICLW